MVQGFQVCGRFPIVDGWHGVACLGHFGGPLVGSVCITCLSCWAGCLGDCRLCCAGCLALVLSASQHWPTEIKEVGPSSWNRWAAVAAGGSCIAIRVALAS
jgi:hypothetical protein